MFKNKYHGGRPKHDVRTASKESFKRFKEEYPSIGISFKQYEEVIRTLNKEYSTYILETGEIVSLPYGLGPIAINKKRGQKRVTTSTGPHILMPVDWGASNKEGKLIYHLNHHTEGYHCKWYWFKYMSRIKSKQIWIFSPSKENSRLLKEYLMNPEKQQHLKYREYNKK